MLESGDSPAKIVEDRGLKQTSDTGAIEKVIADVLAANAEKVEQYRGGKEARFGFFVGQTMKAMGGKANPKVVNELRSEEHTSELQSLMPSSYAVLCLKKKRRYRLSTIHIMNV